MNLSKLITTVFGFLLVLGTFSSCENDNLTSAGTLKVTFANHPNDLIVAISPAENEQLAISDWLKPDSNGALSYNLNVGNYVLTSSSSTFYPKVGFQIRAGQTTNINFDTTNEGHVK